MESEENAGAPRTAADKVLVWGVVVAAMAVLVAAGLIGWSVFGPTAAPRNEAERLLQSGLAFFHSAYRSRRGVLRDGAV
jgi:hypothetical protein